MAIDSIRIDGIELVPRENRILEEFFDGSGGGGGGSQLGSGGTTFVPSSPVFRQVQFTVTSTPIGSAIFIDGENTFKVTPHTFTFSESELLTPKRIDVRRANVISSEEYIISAEAVQTTLVGGTSFTGGGTGPRNQDTFFNINDINFNNLNDPNNIGPRPTNFVK